LVSQLLHQFSLLSLPPMAQPSAKIPLPFHPLFDWSLNSSTNFSTLFLSLSLSLSPLTIIIMIY
jgi:hypothetical protein